MVASAVKGKHVRRPAKPRKTADWYYVLEFEELTSGDGATQFFGNFDSLDESVAWCVKDARGCVKSALKSDVPGVSCASMRRHYAKHSFAVVRNATDVMAVVKWRIRKGELVTLVYDLADCGVREIPATS